MNDWVMSPSEVGTVILVFVIVILIIWMAVLGSRLKKLRKQYLQVMGQNGVGNLEDVILDLRYTLDNHSDELNGMKQGFNDLGNALRNVKGHVGIHRYNAFADHGSDLSFSIAIISDNKDGAVISGLHTREETYVYAKPLNKGQSAYPLTPEEQKAISLALQHE